MGGFKLPSINFNLPAILKGQKLSVGLDIGSHAVKICELAATSTGYKVLSVGSARLPENAVEDGVLQDPAAVAKVISTLIGNLKLRGKKVAISISGYSVIVKKINLNVMTESELERHIDEEAEQYIPFDKDDVYQDFQDLHTNTAEEDRTDVMLVAAKKDVVDAYLDMLRNVGLKTVIVDVDAFALENAYEANFGQAENVALVDIGASKMNINIISKGASILARDVILGSRLLTEQIQNRLDIPYEDAEALKIGIIPPGDKHEILEEIFVNICTQWVTEIKRALDFYSSNYPDEPVSKLVLSGGGAKVKGLCDFFHKETGINVEVFNPFSGTSSDPNKIDAEYLKNLAPEMALSSGLATRPVAI
ncbi:MAG: pilus assembly protein PilM [Proteobacteria bacterium]|nr:pilus assembly protein PilM [Pseudomonadota bacterium]MBU1709106.1 pilus assembly protein PilM [Pseudomonadota bacterium]